MLRSLLYSLFGIYILISPTTLLAVNEQMHSQLIQKLRYVIDNQETEISYLKEKVQNQEERIDSFRQEISSLLKGSKELQEHSTTSYETRLCKFEKAHEKILADLKSMKTHLQDVNSLMKDIRKVLHDHEELSKLQGQDLTNLQSAVKLLGQTFTKTANLATKIEKGIYHVKSGDTLEKIAKQARCSILSLKELNGLSSDKIVIGQELSIPE